MKRMHIHVAVEDIDASTRFYVAMFGGAKPTVSKSHYRKWELSDPNVNFAISQRGVKPGIDHLAFRSNRTRNLPRCERVSRALNCLSRIRRRRPAVMQSRIRPGPWTHRASHGRRFKRLSTPLFMESRAIVRAKPAFLQMPAAPAQISIGARRERQDLQHSGPLHGQQCPKHHGRGAF